jgi:N-acetylneuraminic acid mutarotase
MSYYSSALRTKQLSNGVFSYSNLSQARKGLAAASWGNIILFGGGCNINEDVFNTTVDSYNITTNTWTPITGLSIARAFLAAASANGKIFFAGGIERPSGSNIASSRVDIYDVASNTWSTKTLPSGGRHSLTAIGYNNRVYFAGGSTDGSNSYRVTPSNAIDIYDTTINDWISSKTLTVARAQLASAAINNKILFTCGATSYGPNNYTDAITIYDVLTDTLTQTTLTTVTGNSTEAARGLLGCAAVNNKIVLGGGSYSSSGVSKRVDIYDTVTGNWTTNVNQLSVQRTLIVAVGLNNTILFSSGSNASSQASSQIDIYNGFTNTWTSTILNVGDYQMYELAGAGAGNIIIFGGGIQYYFILETLSYGYRVVNYTYNYTVPYYS